MPYVFTFGSSYLVLRDAFLDVFAPNLVSLPVGHIQQLPMWSFLIGDLLFASLCYQMDSAERGNAHSSMYI